MLLALSLARYRTGMSPAANGNSTSQLLALNKVTGCLRHTVLMGQNRHVAESWVFSALDSVRTTIFHGRKSGPRRGGVTCYLVVHVLEEVTKASVCGGILYYCDCMKGLFQNLSRSILGAYLIGWYGAKDVVLGKARCRKKQWKHAWKHRQKCVQYLYRLGFPQVRRSSITCQCVVPSKLLQKLLFLLYGVA